MAGERKIEFMLDAGKDSCGVWILRSTLRLIMRALFRIEHSGMELIPRQGPLLIVSNHVTYFDPFWIGVACHRRIRYMAWDKIFRFPLAGTLFRWLGAFPVSLTRTEASAFKAAIQILMDSGALVIFPEGGRSTDGSLMPFKNGAANLAIRSGAAIVPVAIVGGEKVWPRGRRFPRPAKVRVFFLPSVLPEFLSPSELTARVRESIEAALASGSRRPTGSAKS